MCHSPTGVAEHKSISYKEGGGACSADLSLPVPLSVWKQRQQQQRPPVAPTSCDLMELFCVVQNNPVSPVGSQAQILQLNFSFVWSLGGLGRRMRAEPSRDGLVRAGQPWCSSFL